MNVFIKRCRVAVKLFRSIYLWTGDKISNLFYKPKIRKRAMKLCIQIIENRIREKMRYNIHIKTKTEKIDVEKSRLRHNDRTLSKYFSQSLFFSCSLISRKFRLLVLISRIYWKPIISCSVANLSSAFFT